MRPNADAPRYGCASGALPGFAALTTVMFAALRIDWSGSAGGAAAAAAPFEPARLHAFFNKTWPNVVRAKGFFWIATRPQWCGEMSMAGALVRHGAAGYWWAAVPKDRWPTDPEHLAMISKRTRGPFGDRKQELVFIGTKDMDEATLRAELDGMLVKLPPHGKIDTKQWAKLPDPFPEWRRGQA